MPWTRLRDGLRIFVEERGRGEPLLLIHGFTGSSRAWGGGLKRALAAHARLLCIDLLGHGRSDKPQRPARYALDAMISDLCEVLDERGLRRAVWLGYSMGGRIALGAACRRPERVHALVLEAASPGIEEASERAARVAQDEALAHRLECDGIDRFVDGWLSQPLFATQKQRLTPARLAEERRRRLANSARALAACLRGMGSGAQPSLWHALPTVQAPTLLVVGADDTKFQTLGRRMRARLAGARLRTVPDVGHSAHLENTRAYTRILQGFLFEIQRPEGGVRHEDGMDAHP